MLLISSPCVLSELMTRLYLQLLHASRPRVEGLNVCFANLASISGANLLKSAVRRVFWGVGGEVIAAALGCVCTNK